MSNPGYLAKFTESLIGYGLIARRAAPGGRRSMDPQIVSFNSDPQDCYRDSRSSIVSPSPCMLAVAALSWSVPLLLWSMFARPDRVAAQSVAQPAARTPSGEPTT